MTTMALIKRFEDILGWQEARKLMKDIYQITGKGDFARDFGIRDQIQRAAVSVMTNIAEGFDCDSQVEFARFLGYSRRSAVEVQSLLYAALDIGYINQTIFDAQYQQTEKAKALIGGLKTSLKKRNP
jgi:four helix bundle protein